MISIFVDQEKEPVPVTVFGEGYGVKIQKGGNYISDDVNFILFDVRFGNGGLIGSLWKILLKHLKSILFLSSAV